MPATITSSLTATGSVTLVKPDTDTLTHVGIYGTYGTVTFVVEATLDGTNWAPVGVLLRTALTSTPLSSTISPADNAVLMYRVPSEACVGVRARVTAISSGTVSFILKSNSYILPVTPG